MERTSMHASLNNPYGSVYIASIACVAPPFSADQTFSAELVKKHFGPKLNARSMGLIRATFSHPSIRKRHFAVDDPACIMDESPDQQIARFTEKSIDLSSRAVTRALEQAGVSVQEVTGLVGTPVLAISVPAYQPISWNGWASPAASGCTTW